MRTIRDWINECKQYLVTENMTGLWPWRDKLVTWLNISDNYKLADKISAINLGPFIEDTDLDYIARVQKDGLNNIVMLLEVQYVSQYNKIFLSHKGIDKPFIREFAQTLKIIGFDPWIDEDAMAAGTTLERGILKGMKESCAAIFFITPQFEDTNFLASEIDYAISEKRVKGDSFAIITLQFQGENGNVGNVPELLHRFVWKKPKTELEALREILRALPFNIYIEKNV